MKRMINTALTVAASVMTLTASGQSRPNVVVVITDDQGYGDLGCNGNTAIHTPNIDRLRSQSIQLDNYHVDPTCAPTRSALMTGRYSDRVGVWHTVQGRNLLRRREVTMANVFQQNGYATGMFGKWHLGDTFNFRPENRGFDRAVYHGGGGVAQAPDYWGNDYFDDIYFVNGVPTRFDGYCTDVWFREGISFIRDQAQAGKPFFAYIAPNAPHGPLFVEEKYAAKYRDKPGVSSPEFYGMVENIDDNMATLMRTLDELGVADNTILVFTTDNGTAGGLSEQGGFTAGMRGKKGSQYEGGHRVPFMIRWPDGHIGGGKSVNRLTAHIDIMPTFIDLCNLEAPSVEFDGTSIRDLLYSNGAAWPDRALVVESQRVVTPEKWRQCAVMTDRWRLVDGNELYDMTADAGQLTDVADQHPEVTARLRADYDTFWNDVSQEHGLTSHMVIGSDEAPVVGLCSHDWLVETVPWNQNHIVRGIRAKEAHWEIEVARDGIYEFSLRRWPVAADKAINDANGGKGYHFTQARMRIADVDETKAIPADAKEVTFRVKLNKGIAKLAPVFLGGNEISTPFFVYVTHQPVPGWQTLKGMGIPKYDPTYGRVPPQLNKRKK